MQETELPPKRRRVSVRLSFRRTVKVGPVHNAGAVQCSQDELKNQFVANYYFANCQRSSNRPPVTKSGTAAPGFTLTMA